MRALTVFFMFSVFASAAQTGPVRPKMVMLPNPNPTRWNNNILFTDVQGRPFANLYEGIEGSAYLLSDFRWGRLETKTGKAYDSVQVSLDLYHHELHVILNGKEIVAQDGLVRWLSIRDTVDGKPIEYVFQSGFPSVDKNTSFHFYQILSAGTISLLLHRKMELEKTVDVMSGTPHERFVPVEQLYVYDGKLIRRMERDPAFLEQLFADRAAQYRAYMKSHKVSPKNREHLVKLFEAMKEENKKAF